VCFFQEHWDTIGAAIPDAVLDFLNNGNFDLAINATFITLIHKVFTADSVNDFCPVSLCNVIYKLIAKVLADRLQLVSPSIISQHQSAFVPS
jgi:hypothetical protein